MGFLCKNTQQMSTVQQQLPDYIDAASKGLIQKATDVTTAGYNPYIGPRIAGFTQDQLDAFQKIREMQGYGADEIQAATDRMKEVSEYRPDDITAQQVGAQKFDSQAAQDYMNPYTEQVLDRVRQRAYRADDIARQGRDARAVQAGAFGGSRQAVAEAEAQRGLQDRLADQEAKALERAYTTGQQAFRTDADRALIADRANQAAQLGADKASAQAGLQGAQLRAKGAQGLMGLVGQGQGLTAQQLGLLQGVGGAQQAMGQSSLDLAYQDFMNQQNHPYKQLGFMSDILRGTPYGSTQVYSQPGPSPMQSMAGLGIAGLGLYGMGGGFTPGGFSFNQMGQNMFGM
tara:strand:+ start:4681 stop:5712 length:1032 start_codon:yes stop_codon:yes gene_type:complete